MRIKDQAPIAEAWGWLVCKLQSVALETCSTPSSHLSSAKKLNNASAALRKLLLGGIHDRLGAGGIVEGGLSILLQKKLPIDL